MIVELVQLAFSGVFESIRSGELAYELLEIIGGLFALFSSTDSFFVQTCNGNDCPGSSYSLITTAWANIGYMTHSDFLHLMSPSSGTDIHAWAPLLYVVGAIGGLISVALNSPPRNYAWFFVGPAIFSFLVFTTEDVGGVAWKVGGQRQNMEDVWKNAETGLANTRLVNRLGIRVSKDSAPSGKYPVAWMLVFLDGLFSATTDTLIGWIGISRQSGTGGSDTNLASSAGGDAEGPWHVLANLKWPMATNIANVSARDPDVRDALVTFLASECGDGFKKGINSGAYIASSQSKGGTVPDTVVKSKQQSLSIGSFFGLTPPVNISWTDYQDFVRAMDTEVIPTPRSVVRLFNQEPQQQGTFTQFSQVYGNNEQITAGRTTEIVCSEYLYTIIQALRWEAGHSYWQLLRSAPNGFTEDNLLTSLFYGWDIRPQANGPYASQEELKKFTKMLILSHLLRNELLFAPQIVEGPQRFAPSEQAKGFTETYVRDQGSQAKAGELYNWAVLMPHVQGVLTYLILVAYPFAAMLMVIPGYWKAFFTWITFFAWVKIWDVGFAMVHVLERSVWAMIGNHSSMASFAKLAIATANDVGDIQVGEQCDGTDDKYLQNLCAVPDVKEASQLNDIKAWKLIDKLLILSGMADLDLSNGYYIYIMAALYFAVPAVTGQLVLGAKAGLGSIATQGIQQNAQEAGGAAKSGTVGEANQRIGTNTAALGQAAKAKGYRQSGLALQQLDNMNAAMDAGINQERMEKVGGALSGAADARGLRASSFDKNFGVQQAILGFGIDAIPGGRVKSGTGSGAGGATGKPPLERVQGGGKLMGRGYVAAGRLASSNLDHDRMGMQARAGMYKADAAWDGMASGQRAKGFQAHAERLGQLADFDADTNSWEARNAFGYQIAGSAGVYGANPGGLTAGPKPESKIGFAMSGQLGGRAAQAGFFTGGQFFGNVDRAVSPNKAALGSNYYGSHWQGDSAVNRSFASGGQNWNGHTGQLESVAHTLTSPIGGLKAEYQEAENAFNNYFTDTESDE